MDTRKHTPGFRAVLVSDECFTQLKELQSYRTCGHLPVRFDLKDLATAVIEEGFATPAFTERVLQRALAQARRRLDGVVNSPLSPP